MRTSHPSIRTVFIIGEQRLALPCGDYLVGRSRECAIRLDDRHVSRVQLRCRVMRDQTTIENRGGKNRVLLNGRALQGVAHNLAHGDEIVVGSTTIQVLFEPVRADQEFEEDTVSITGNACDGPGAEIALDACPACSAVLEGDPETCPHCGEPIRYRYTRTQELPQLDD